MSTRSSLGRIGIRAAKVFGIIAFCALLALAALDRYWAYHESVAEHAYLAAGYSLDFNDYLPEKPASDDNAAPLLDIALSQLKCIDGNHSYLNGCGNPLEDGIDNEKEAAWDAWYSSSWEVSCFTVHSTGLWMGLQDNRDALELAELALARTSCRWPDVDFVETLGIIDFNRHGGIRQLARLILIRAHLLWNAGEYDAALDDCLLLIDLAEATRAQRTLTSHLVGQAVIGMPQDFLGNVDTPGWPTPAKLRELSGALLHADRDLDLSGLMQAERAMQDEILKRFFIERDILSDFPDDQGLRARVRDRAIQPLFRFKRVQLLDYTRRLLSGLPYRYPQANAELQQAWSETHLDALGQIPLVREYVHELDYALIVGVLARLHARNRSAAAGMLIAADVLEGKPMPDSLSHLSEITTTDPYTGDSLHFGYDRSYIRIYSVGPNGLDDSGKRERDARGWDYVGPDRADDVEVVVRLPADGDEI